MAFKKAVCAAAALILLALPFASGERAQPKVVGNNMYSKKLYADPITPFTLEDALKSLNANGKLTVGDYMKGFSPRTFTWNSAELPEGQTMMRVIGEYGTLMLIVERSPFSSSDGIATNAQEALTDRVLEREAILCGIQWRDENMPFEAPRGVNVGSTIDKTLNAYQIVEICDDGFIYDNATLYTEEESLEVKDKVEGRLSIEKENIVIRLTAYCLDGGSYVLAYEFNGDKVAKITLEHQ